MSGSGNLLADRRFAWAQALGADGDHAAAADLLEQTIGLVPEWAPAWAALAEACQRLGQRERAAAAWRHAAAADHGGQLGAEVRAALFSGQALPGMPEPYLRALFDDYAPRFERHLVDGLNYRGPELIVEAVAALAAQRRFARALDLGCGTGLMGRALLRHVAAVDGIDLSPGMVEAARRTGIYRQLWAGSLIRVLADLAPNAYDLVTAADVLVYSGDLAPLMTGVARVLSGGGLFGFTTQLMPGSGASAHSAPGDAPESPAFVLGDDLRFAHSLGHVEQAARDAGLRLASCVEAWARTENGIGVPGLVAVAERA